MGLFDLGGKLKNRHVAGVKNSRFIEPHDCEDIDAMRVKYKNAEKLAADLGDIPTGFRAFVIIDGTFIMGDLIEAVIMQNNWVCTELTISTLSMSMENVDSLKNLIVSESVQQLNLVVSDYYFQTERRGIMPYVYDQLDIGDRFQLAVASVHTKVALIRTECGKKIVIHGSANLRSSSNIEQIVVENSPMLFDFNAEIHNNIIARHKTINHDAVLADVARKPEEIELFPDIPKTKKQIDVAKLRGVRRTALWMRSDAKYRLANAKAVGKARQKAARAKNAGQGNPF